MVEIKIESINKEDVNLEDILSEIAKEINKGKITGDTIQWDYRDKTLDNDKNALKSLEEMKKELII